MKKETKEQETNEQEIKKQSITGKSGKDTRKVLTWLYQYNRRHLWKIFILALTAAVISGSFILLALISQKILDIATGAQQGSIPTCCVTLLAIIGMQALLNILNANLRIRVVTELEMNLRQKIFSVLLRKKYADVKLMHSGEILNRFTSDIDVIVSGLTDIFPQLISILTKLFGGMVVLFVVDRKFTLLILAIGFFVMLCSRLYSRKFRDLHKEVQRTNGTVRSFLQECIENIVVIKSFVTEGPIRKQLEKYQMENYRVRKKRTAVSNIANTAVYVLFAGGYYAALVWGAIGIAAGQMTFGTVAAFLQIIDQIKAPFRNMSGLLPEYYSMLASAERMMELEVLPDEEVHTRISDVDAFYEKFRAIHLEHADFSYEDHEIVLEDASLVIEKGSFSAIVGSSGAGKSTLLKLLLSLDTLENGRLFFETTEGDVPVDAGLRSVFAYVPQGNLILSGTIRENIAFGNGDVSPSQICKAAEIACIADEIIEFPDGYETLLGERGMGLSEGQAQRIAIARAILNQAPILLLDECTSALDPQTEEKLLNNLNQLQNRTIICVSHKDATIQNCDQIIRLEKKQFIRENERQSRK